jgi:hypothetical protein
MEAVSTRIRQEIRRKVALKAIGNSRRTMRDVAVDLINASKLDWTEIADGTFLAVGTIGNLAKDRTQFPRYDTIERLFRFFEYEVQFKDSHIKAEFRNTPKERLKHEDRQRKA